MKLTQTARRFVARYPITLREAISTPMIFQGNVPGFTELPHPRVELIRDLSAFAGFSAGALRTALSRARAAGEVEGFTDPAGVTRYRLTELQREVSEVVRGWQERPEGFLVGIFSFHAREEAERRAVRETLAYFGFKRIAQNAYVNGMIDTAGLEAELERAGVADRCYLFRCPSVEDPALLERLSRALDVAGRAAVLARFQKELEAFLDEPGLTAMETGRRIFYSGPAHHRQCFVDEPPIPARIVPPGYPLDGLRAYLARVIAERMDDCVIYYRTLCG
jgi:DNA-binding transcriptional regulator PaaX